MPRKTSFQNKYKKGDRVFIKQPHPWHNNWGSVTGYTHTPIGHGIKVFMDNEGLECVVLKKEHLDTVES
jgi:hypothetical protein